MPKGVKADVLSFWGPTRTASSRTTSSASAAPRAPALAHAFINFMLDEKNAYNNFVNFTGYTPQKGIDAEALLGRT